MRGYRCVFARRRRIRGLELSEQQHEDRLQNLENGYTMLSHDYTRLNDAIVKISESLVQLVVIQEQNKSIMQCIEHQSSTIDSLDRRLDAIEVHMPALLELRTWVLAGLGLIVSAFFIELVVLVVK